MPNVYEEIVRGHRVKQAIAPLLVLALVVPALAGCTQSEPAPDVMATFYPLAFLAERIGGPNLTVGTLVPPGVEPHDWEPSSADFDRLGRSNLLLAQGAGFEPWLDGIQASLGDRAPPTTFTTEGLPLVEGGEAHEGEVEVAGHEGEEGAVDPHTWLDPVLFAQQARAVADAMAVAFPAEADGIRARAASLEADLEQLHREYEASLATCETRVIIANHDAFGYPARRYGFEVVAISGLSPEAEPSPQDLSSAIEAAREHNVTIIFFEDLVSPRVAQIVADEVGATTRVLSPVEGLTDASRAAGEDYATLMRQNLRNLEEAMRCR